MPSQKLGNWDRAADLEAIKTTYSRYAEAGRAKLWDEQNRGYARLALELTKSLHQAMRRSATRGTTRILDLGCGTGDLAGKAAGLSLRTDWVGVDLRADAIELARAAHPGARFVQASADAVPEPDASFDIVVAKVLFSSLPSVHLERAVAMEIGRLLRAGGWLVWLDLRYSNPSNPAVHGLSMLRIRELFPGWELELTSAGLLPPIARRLGPTAGLLYPVMSGLPALRSHHVGRLRRPADTAG